MRLAYAALTTASKLRMARGEITCPPANRTAPAPQGPWGPEQMLVSSLFTPGGVYAPFLHPWSNGKDIYYNLSLWSAYNVMLMHTVLP